MLLFSPLNTIKVTFVSYVPLVSHLEQKIEYKEKMIVLIYIFAKNDTFGS